MDRTYILSQLAGAVGAVVEDAVVEEVEVGAVVEDAVVEEVESKVA
jgi:hypothetical protein